MHFYLQNIFKLALALRGLLLLELLKKSLQCSSVQVRAAARIGAARGVAGLAADAVVHTPVTGRWESPPLAPVPGRRGELLGW